MKRFRSFAAVSAVVLAGATACSSGGGGTTSNAVGSLTQAGSTATSSSAASASSSVTVTDASGTTTEIAEHDEVSDHTWSEADVVAVKLTGASATAASSAVTSSAGTVTISAPGTYRLTGTLAGRLVVNSSTDGVVRLLLAGVDITSSSSAALFVQDAEKVVIVLEGSSLNTLTDATTYTFPDATTDEPDAALFSKADLTIDGPGTLKVRGNFEDGIASKDSLLVTGGTIDVVAKDDGLRGKDELVVRGGTLTVKTTEGDTLHSTDLVAIQGGTFTLTSGDDGVHADLAVTISGGTIRIPKSYEGIEANAITISGGDLEVVSSDDGINGAGGVDGSGTTPGATATATATAATPSLAISGGRIAVNANGDGVDINGTITMSGGTLLVDGPTQNMNGAIDYDRSFVITGGTVIAAGSSGMAQAPGTGSTQASVAVTFTSAQAAGSTVKLLAADGSEIASFTPAKTYQSLVVSAPALVAGTAYKVTVNGTEVASATAATVVQTGGAGPGGMAGGARPVR